MDLKEYYRKIREIEAGIREADAVIVCGGKMSEAPRAVAARLIADGKATLATEEAAEKFRAQTRERWSKR